MTGAHPAFDKLRAEHRLLLATVDAFEVFVAKRARDTNAAKDFATFVEFLRETDHSHHQKEERALDPFLIKCGFTWDAGPLGQMRRFHDRERKLIRILRQAEIDGWPGVVDNEAEVLAAIAELIASQRKHITLEDEVVFPIAEQKLDAAEHASLAHEIEQFEREQCDTTVLGDLIARVRALCERHSLDDSAT